MDKKKIKIAAGLTAVFFLGILTGSLGTGIYVKHRIGRFVKGDLTERHAAIMKKLSNRLDLTLSQQSEIGKIIANALKELSSFRQKHRAEAETVIDNAVEMIKEKLDEKQRHKMDELRRELKVFGLPERRSRRSEN